MKKVFLLLLSFILLQSCIDHKVEDIAAYEFNNAWYWVGQYKEDATEQDIKDFVKRNTHPFHTCHFFIFPSDADLSVFEQRGFNALSFAQQMVIMQPEYGLYKLPNDNHLYDDGFWLIEQSLEYK